ncbi:hypothetical protein [Methylobacterium nigriterrae]|uniref:hypothetical protein n=1 Tax=Methylobacterium nigriterrae TaxID=3127512 RepID=UPI003013A1FE
MKAGFLLILTIIAGAQRDDDATAVFDTRDRCEKVGQMAAEQALTELSARGVRAGSAWFRCEEVRGRAIGGLTHRPACWELT